MNSGAPLDRVRIVLASPSHPGNIGAAARAMKTMGLSQLYLVNPLRFPDPQADAMAAGALDVLTNAQVCNSLEEALAGTVQAAALSARRRELAVPVASIREGARALVSLAATESVALVFGTELHGLSNAELSRCQMLIRIPANPEYSSLNLAAAVQVLCYELRMAAISETLPESRPELARHEELELFYRTLEQTLIEIGFLDPANPRRLMPRLRRMFARTRLEREELNILMGVLRALREQSERQFPNSPES
jgi:tRNA/rRNA methyltransferase